jgi:DNA polymerase-3 subunit delta
MAGPRAIPSESLILLCGDDDLAVKQRAAHIYETLCGDLGGMDHEIVEASGMTVADALKSLARLREALQTLPFFGGGKVVWFKNCDFLGDGRTATSKTVTAELAELADMLKKFDWGEVRLLISADKVDKRKSFYKTIKKIGAIESFAGWSENDRDWAGQAESWARQQLRAQQKDISEEAVAQLVAYTGPNARQLNNEVEKLIVFVGERRRIDLQDVDAIATRNKQARAFALGDALGDRNLTALLRALDEELWAMKTDSKKSEIGMLYGLISKVRVMIFLKEMVAARWLRAGGAYPGFKAQLERVPPDAFPEDRRINPLSMNPYVLFKALPQAARYTRSELIKAMDLLLQCNRSMVSSGADSALTLQKTLTEIIRGEKEPAGSNGRRAA